MIKYFGAILLFMLFSGSSPAQPLAFTDIIYVDSAGYDPYLQSIDIYTDATFSRQPVLVYVHGGMWREGDKSYVHEKPEATRSRDWLLVSANYRLWPDANIREQAGDVAAAIAWTYRNIAHYGGDSSKIVVMGHSAGAHLVSLVATDESYLSDFDLDPGIIRALSPLDTRVYDLQDMARHSWGDTLHRSFAQVFGQDSVGWKMASPIAHISPGKRIPPMLIAYSNGDRPDPYRKHTSSRFMNALRLAGYCADTVDALRHTHAGIDISFAYKGDRVSNAVFDFFEKILTSTAFNFESEGVRFSVTPQPVCHAADFSIEINEPSFVQIRITYEDSAPDIIFSGELPAGFHEIHADLTGYPGGIYELSAEFPAVIFTGSLLILY